MHPVLLDLGFIRIHTYGVMAALGFIAALSWIRYDAKKQNMPVQHMLDLAFYLIVFGVLGARLMYVLQNWELFSNNPIDIVKIWQGGLVWYGGVLISAPLLYYYCKRYQLSFWKIADVFAPAVSLGHALGRIGCFAAGCCFGRPAPDDAWYAVVFHKIAFGLAPADIALYPTQLMESAAEFALAILLILWVRRHKAFDGQVFLSYLVLYSIIRSIIEVFRGDLDRHFIMEDWLGQMISTSQFISFFALIFALVFGFILYKSKKKQF